MPVAVFSRRLGWQLISHLWAAVLLGALRQPQPPDRDLAVAALRDGLKQPQPRELESVLIRGGCLLFVALACRDTIRALWVISGRGPGARLLACDIGVRDRLRRGFGFPSGPLRLLAFTRRLWPSNDVRVM